MLTAQTRRRFLTMLSLAGAGGLVGAPSLLAKEEALETTTVRLTKVPSICISPQYVADELLRAEGFTDVRYVNVTFIPEAMEREEIDFSLDFASDYISAIDRGKAVTVLAGMDVGCYDLFVGDDIHSVTKLRGRRIAIADWWGPAYVFLAIIATQVGLDPKEIGWVVNPSGNLMQLLLDGETDAYLGLPP